MNLSKDTAYSFLVARKYRCSLDLRHAAQDNVCTGPLAKEQPHNLNGLQQIQGHDISLIENVLTPKAKYLVS